MATTKPHKNLASLDAAVEAFSSIDPLKSNPAILAFLERVSPEEVAALKEREHWIDDPGTDSESRQFYALQYLYSVASTLLNIKLFTREEFGKKAVENLQLLDAEEKQIAAELEAANRTAEDIYNAHLPAGSNQSVDQLPDDKRQAIIDSAGAAQNLAFDHAAIS